MKKFQLEIQTSHRQALPEFIQEMAKAIQEGYGAGNCTCESVAFWTSTHRYEITPKTFIVSIEFDDDTLSDSEYSAGIRKVTSDPEGDIVIFGTTVGRWTTLEYTPQD
jgi:hypothetical protein